MLNSYLFRRTFRGVWRRIVPDDRSSEAFDRAVKLLKPHDTAVDCGANVGVYTAIMARNGATVHAFEPDPVAFAALEKRLGRKSNVILHRAAISNRSGSARLYFHNNRAQDPVKLSQSSSLLDSKTNVSANDHIDVKLIDAADFIQSLGNVSLMKMDVEGHEIEILNHLIDRDCAYNILQAFVEVHDRKNPALRIATDALRARVEQMGLPFDLNWH